MDMHDDKSKNWIVVRKDTKQKVSGAVTESEAHRLAKDKALKESVGTADLEVKQILNG